MPKKKSRFKIHLNDETIHAITPHQWQLGHVVSYHEYVDNALVLGIAGKPGRHIEIKADAEGNLYVEFEDK